MEQLWCVHIIGPDDLHAAPDKAAAEARAAEVNVALARIKPSPEEDPNGHWPNTTAVVAEWPWDAPGHAKDLANWNGEW